jgi:hypothetical protein
MQETARRTVLGKIGGEGTAALARQLPDRLMAQ